MGHVVEAWGREQRAEGTWQRQSIHSAGTCAGFPSLEGAGVGINM
jgi:hypothetical protein